MKKNNETTGFPVYQCLLPVSRQTVVFCAGLLTRHLRQIKSPFRSRPARKIVTLVLAILRHDQRIFDMAGGNDIGETTLRRWRDELLALLAAQAPRLDRALRKVARRGGEVVLIDGTLVATVRRTGGDNRLNYSGKHRRHGLHFLALTDEKGRLLWISAARPGATHDVTAARRDNVVRHLREAGLGALADLGFVGLDTTPDSDDPVVITGFKATRAAKLNPAQKQANQVLAAARAPVEHGFANLKCWRILTKLRTNPARATHLLRALLVLTNREIRR
ncbi:transposase family protein (plasmid) [Streptomyces sp. NBC_01220]|uniref:transposase family protein n=1 Tax=Streptomyces sp. NBC_01220 TaxID=2903781 RepID=UPI00352C2368|nr:transposase family protein [Streptomyces sp. NBC_01220]